MHDVEAVQVRHATGDVDGGRQHRAQVADEHAAVEGVAQRAHVTELDH